MLSTSGVSKSTYEIIVGGQDISSVIRPILTDLSVSLTSGGASDGANVSIDDTGGRVVMPKDDEDVIIRIGWEGGHIAEVFRGQGQQHQECRGP